VCLDQGYEPSDQIKQCELCLSAIHQSCFGRELTDFTSDGKWVCPRCVYLLRNPGFSYQQVKCYFCPSFKGIILPIQDSVIAAASWAHQVCINWNPDLKFFGQDCNRIGGHPDPERMAMRCSICFQKDAGYCIDCDSEGCPEKFHIKCAVEHRVIREWNYMIRQALPGQPDCIPLFCLSHNDEAKELLQTVGNIGDMYVKNRPHKNPLQIY